MSTHSPMLKSALLKGSIPLADIDSATAASSSEDDESSAESLHSDKTAGGSDTATLVERPALNKSLTTPETGTTTKLKQQLKKRRRALFKARMSQFDLSNPETSNDTFRGFYTLFWLIAGLYLIQTAIRYFEQEGTIISLGFFRLFSKDGLALLISDVIMVSTTLASVPFAKLLLWGLPYEPLGVTLQHIGQAAFLAISIYWIFWRDWPWVQSGFFTLHAIVMMMKMHSYTALNGDLATRYRRLKQLKKEIPEWIAERTKDDRELTHDEKNELDDMEAEVKFLDDELVYGNTRYPDNLTFANYFDYLLVPSLVYSLEFPRTERIRPWYVFEKTVATLGTFLLLYVTTEHYILPKLYDPHMSDLRVIVELLLPFMINYLFIFYIIFECILNGFAEISRFADRNFYDDWWNSVTYDEFARKWNKPVHKWLLRYVYAESMESYQLSKSNATFVTFLLSAGLHELVLVIVTRRIRFYLFVMQMLQLPLIVMGRHPMVKSHSTLGNVIFWLGMFVGLPLLAILYCREAFWSSYIFG
ncbi:MBOAT, membrane-bound O-acyltransferase family-domain-containing protein [Syncephalastrum racemosum]|uniref:O-acyltransferase n=1 Tax=Syncephalastrum racemosum TaxID=13706 RepID=A0A1X2HCY1_SYNRA|nr:MBOAT, membrane-bound O-acyltransferase family-domain-containing protein [Syncephalastrum racemosum]